PGVKQLSYSYTLPARAFPLTFAHERFTGVFEVLLEEPSAQVRATGLRSMGEVTTQGRQFKRFLAQSAPKGETVRIDVPVTSAGTRTTVLVSVAIVIALTMVATLARALLRRRAPRDDRPAAAESVETLAAAIAALDARHDAGDATLDDGAYTRERAALKARLSASLAARSDAS
ncbi:MAG: hypothetical protein HOQ19_08585, partial [Gemmatimonadaceae bacterium]|nr:hypothetical protein [Gemmatimonadaceae bacterium]